MNKKNVCIYQIVPEEAYYRKDDFLRHQLVVIELINNTPGWTFRKIYLDNKSCRTAFAELMDDCNSGTVDIIVTKSLNSFADTPEDALHIMRQLLIREPSVEVLFTDEALFSTDADKLKRIEERYRSCRHV